MADADTTSNSKLLLYIILALVTGGGGVGALDRMDGVDAETVEVRRLRNEHYTKTAEMAQDLETVRADLRRCLDGRRMR